MFRSLQTWLILKADHEDNETCQTNYLAKLQRVSLILEEKEKHKKLILAKMSSMREITT